MQGDYPRAPRHVQYARGSGTGYGNRSGTKRRQQTCDSRDAAVVARLKSTTPSRSLNRMALLATRSQLLLASRSQRARGVRPSRHTDAVIETSTREWIAKFVIGERLCPFAKASRILVRVDKLGSDGDAAWALDPLGTAEHARLAAAGIVAAEAAVHELLQTEVPHVSANSNLFLVWPHGLADLDTFRSFVSAITHRSGLDFASVTGESADAPAVAFPFHPAMDDYRFRSPWPMAHIIPQGELTRARQQLRARKRAGKACLVSQNARAMREATSERRAAWDGLLQDLREGV